MHVLSLNLQRGGGINASAYGVCVWLVDCLRPRFIGHVCDTDDVCSHAARPPEPSGLGGQTADRIDTQESR